MANQKQLEILMQGVDAWNKWRDENPNVKIDLGFCDLFKAKLNGVNFSNATLSGTNLFKADLNHAVLHHAKLENANLFQADLNGTELHHAKLENANLFQANFRDANLYRADIKRATLFKSNLIGANLSEADFTDANLFEANFLNANVFNTIFNRANLYGADFSYLDLRFADFGYANLAKANLSNTDIRGGDLFGCVLTETDLSGANLTGVQLSHASMIKTIVHHTIISKSKVYGINVWDLEGEFSEQQELIITPEETATITVDNIKIAQFVYLILSNKEIQSVINTLTSKTVLILGRFALPERKIILDGLREKLREYNLLPIVFDFERPTDKDFTETIKTLASLSYFVIADVTKPKSSPLELQATVPDYQIPFVPIIQEGESPFAMMVDLQKKYDWVLKTVSYDSQETLMKVLKPLIIDPAMKKRQELRIIKAQEPEVISAKDYLAKSKE